MITVEQFQGILDAYPKDYWLMFRVAGVEGSTELQDIDPHSVGEHGNKVIIDIVRISKHPEPEEVPDLCPTGEFNCLGRRRVP